jgi:hypothetical protein
MLATSSAEVSRAWHVPGTILQKNYGLCADNSGNYDASRPDQAALSHQAHHTGKLSLTV